MSTQAKPSATSSQQQQQPRQGSASGSRASGGAGAPGGRPTSSRPTGRQSTKPTASTSPTSGSSSSSAATAARNKATGAGHSHPDDASLTDPALAFDAGECIPLLDVFVSQDWVGELDAFVEVMDTATKGGATGAGNTWSVPVVPFAKPVTTAEYPGRAVANVDKVLSEAEREIMLMAKWAEKIRLRAPLPPRSKLNSDGDLRDRHVVQFHHSTYLWCKEHNLTRDQTSVVLSMGKLLFDRILTSVHKGFEPYESPIPITSETTTTKSNASNTSLKALAGSKPVLVPGGAGKKGGADKPPPPPAMTLASNLSVIPAGILRAVLDAYLVKLVAFHTIPSPQQTGASGHGAGHGAQQQQTSADGGKHQVLTSKVGETVVQYFRTALLSQIRLIRLAFTSIPRRYSKTYASSRPSSSFNRTTLPLDMLADTKPSAAPAEVNDWRIPPHLRGATRNPPTTGMAAIWYNEPGMVEFEDSDLDEDIPPPPAGASSGTGNRPEAAASISKPNTLATTTTTGQGGGLVGEIQGQMIKALVGVVRGNGAYAGSGAEAQQGV